MATNVWLGTTSGDYSVTTNWSLGAVPTTGDDVIIQGSVSITAGLNQSAVAIDEFTVDPSYSGLIGTIDAYLRIDPDSFQFAGTGKAFIDVGAAAISPTIRNTATPSTGQMGLYLKGSALATLTVNKGTVGVAVLAGETSSVTTTNCLFTTNQNSDSSVTLGTGVTATTVNQSGGTTDIRCAATTINVSGGTMTTSGSGAVTTMNVTGGTVYSNSTGTITTLNANGGTVDFTRSLTARTVTTTNFAGGDTTLKADDAILTQTNKPDPSGKYQLDFKRL